MSVRASAWVWEHSTVEHRGDLLVLLALADHAHDDGSAAYPSVETLARKARLSRRGTFEALKRLKRIGAISPEGHGPRGTVSYRINMVQPMHGAATAPVQPGAAGGAVTSTQGVNPTAPEPPIEPSDRNRPPARAGARGTGTPSGDYNDIATHVLGVLQRGVDGLTTDERGKPPTHRAVLAVLREHKPSRETAEGVAIATRATCQAQNRAPNIVALYAQKLAKARPTTNPQSEVGARGAELLAEMMRSAA